MKRLQKKMSFYRTKINPTKIEREQTQFALVRAFLGLAMRLAEVDGTSLEESLELAGDYGEQVDSQTVWEFSQAIAKDVHQELRDKK